MEQKKMYQNFLNLSEIKGRQSGHVLVSATFKNSVNEENVNSDSQSSDGVNICVIGVFQTYEEATEMKTSYQRLFPSLPFLILDLHRSYNLKENDDVMESSVLEMVPSVETNDEEIAKLSSSESDSEDDDNLGEKALEKEDKLDENDDKKDPESDDDKDDKDNDKSDKDDDKSDLDKDGKGDKDEEKSDKKQPESDSESSLSESDSDSDEEKGKDKKKAIPIRRRMYRRSGKK